MKITILTLFPEMFTGVLNSSILKRAQAKGLVEFEVRYLRDWTSDAHKTVDDRPYGGGAGMVLKADVIYRALCEVAGINKVSQKISKSKVQMSKQISNPKSKIKKQSITKYQLSGRGGRSSGSEADGGATSAGANSKIILPTPKGELFNQRLALKYSQKSHLVFVCPHYEGYDERIVSMVTDQVSMGEYIVTGGEIPAMMMIDAVTRLVKGVIKKDLLREESFNVSERGGRSSGSEADGGAISAGASLEYAQYTRPEILEITLRGKKIKKHVPKVLLSGNHALIAKWRKTS